MTINTNINTNLILESVDIIYQDINLNRNAYLSHISIVFATLLENIVLYFNL